MLAADLIEDNMTVGLGTGSTASWFIKHLGIRYHKGLRISAAIATSEESQKLAVEYGLPVVDIDDVTTIDVTVDGADEVDKKKRLVKGGGGALLREKIVASSSKEMIVIIDESKVVEKLGAFGLPIEIVPFGRKTTIRKLKEKGFHGILRMSNDISPFVTNNNNHIVDITFSNLRDYPEDDHNAIIAIPGVIETGFFFNIAKRVIIGNYDGTIEML